MTKFPSSPIFKQPVLLSLMVAVVALSYSTRSFYPLLFCLVSLLFFAVIRKVLADYVNIHYEGLRLLFNLKEGCLEIEIWNLVCWIVWFEHPETRSVPVDLKLIYKTLPSWFFIEQLQTYSSTLPIERWDEKNRLMLYCLGHVKISFPAFKRNDHFFLVQIENMRIHNPRETIQITNEQKIIYPNGYPNFIEPIYQIISRFKLDYLIKIALKNSFIELNQIQVHGITNAAFSHKNNEKENMLVPFKQLIKDARDLLFMEAPEQIKTRSDELLTFVIGEARIQSMSEKSIDVHLEKISVYEGNNFIFSGNRNDHASMRMDGVHLKIELKEFLTKFDSTKVVKNKLLIPLANDKNRLLVIMAKIEISPKIEINSNYIASLIQNAKEKFIKGNDKDQILKPLFDLWWEDAGAGDLTKSLISSLVIGFLYGATNLTQTLEFNQEISFHF